MWNLENITSEYNKKEVHTHRYREQPSSYQWWEGGGDIRVGGTNYWVKDRPQGCTVQHGEYSKYSIITVNGV